MGRRKIEIKAIKDDRNRSVTFLKRKGGLFKKAHELSVLCSVDVAVIVFGNNKKLYEYSSSDIGEILQRHNFYGGANEHKGPADFNGKRDEDDDDDDGSIPDDGHSQEPPMMPRQFANQAAFQHMRQAPSSSPPISNSTHFQHIQRQHTPQPQMGSRPASRNAPQRVNSNLAQQHMQQPQPSPPVNGYAYMPQPAIYNPQHGPGMPPHPQQQQQPSFQYPGPPPPPPPHHLQQVYMEEQRRASMPSGFPQQERQNSGPINTPPQPQQQLPSQQHQQQPGPPPPQQHQPPPQTQQAPPPAQMLEPVKRMSVKSRSIFTPIDESRSILSQHWASSTSAAETSRSEPARTSSISSTAIPPVPPTSTIKSPPPPAPKRTVSLSTTATFTPPPGPPSRTNSIPLPPGKRPRLKVQIPDEPSDGGSTGSTTSPRDDATGSNANRRGVTAIVTATDGSHSSGVVLPPPSPSASAVLSAGASGPPNPFARPHPVGRDGRERERDSVETPVSALPSRFMNNEFLPSPSSFYPEWNFRGGDGNTLPSPLNFATPIVGSGPSFLRDEGQAGGQPGPGMGMGAGVGVGVGPAQAGKRKSPDAEGGDWGDAKRVKHET